MRLSLLLFNRSFLELMARPLVLCKWRIQLRWPSAYFSNHFFTICNCWKSFQNKHL
jgi:hypothetical protein